MCGKKNIKCGEELTVFYNTHYFGRFNKDCLCPHKIEHSDPCPKDPEPARKKRIIERENLSTPQNAISKKPEMVQTPVRRIVIEKLPPRRVLYAPVLSNANEQSEKSLSYESVFGEIDLSLSPIKHSTPLAQRLDQSFSSNGVEPVETSSLNSSIHSLVNLSSTPVRLDLLETEVDIPYIEPVKVSLFQEEGTPLFEGSRASTESFFKEFNSLCDTHTFSKAARHDVLKLFSKSLPVPNNLHVKLVLPSLPTISLIEFTDAHFCCVDIKTQMERILTRNAQYVLRSWENNCTWSTAWDHFRQPEVQLVLNADGAPVFKSSKLAVWPIWVQIFNLPPKLRAAFSNLSLLGIWYCKSKPDFSKLLPRICYELESLFDADLIIEHLGIVTFCVRSIVADMPAKACLLCMVQFNGYSACPHCYMRGYSHSRRMLFPVKKDFRLRESNDFKVSGLIAEQKKVFQSGVKSQTPLIRLVDLPWRCPIDPMHQVFLGTGKVLSKLLVSVAKGNLYQLAETNIKSVKIPFDFQHRTRSLNEIHFWKAFDFKLFFFM